MDKPLGKARLGSLPEGSPEEGSPEGASLVEGNLVEGNQRGIRIEGIAEGVDRTGQGTRQAEHMAKLDTPKEGITMDIMEGTLEGLLLGTPEGSSSCV